MFKVKATVIAFLGDKEKYPCHHQYKLGDEFTFDGASFSGTICPSLALEVVPKMMELHSAGPRYRDYIYYYPFLFSPTSADAPELKKYDGLGYKNVFVPRGGSSRSNAFTWPPAEDRTAMKDITLICPDRRTAVQVKLEAFDLSDKGRNIPYFRRAMVILDKVSRKPGIKADKILSEFRKEQIEGIYPALSNIMVQVLAEELELMGYLEIREGKVYPTGQAGPKLEDFKVSLSEEEIKALEIG
jgi:uncharacterized repeat protein (TIGR04076 family)